MREYTGVGLGFDNMRTHGARCTKLAPLNVMTTGEGGE
jgi:hypothetical protein